MQAREVVMRWRRWWSIRLQRRRARQWRLALAWQTCQRCGAYALLPDGVKPICESCRSLQ